MIRFGSPAVLVALVLALIVGTAISLVQFDRQARTNPAMVQFVPAGLGGFADEQRARLLLATDPIAAEPHVKNVVRARPVDGSHLSHLAIWAAEAGDMALASQTLSEAARRGWRDTFVQISVLGSAAAEQNLLVASQRLDALARSKAQPAILMRALDILLTVPGAETSLAERLAESEYLQDVLVEYSRKRPGTGEALSVIVGAMPQYGTALDCMRRASIVRSLARRGEAAALKVWGTDCATQTIDQLDFTFSERRDDPFAWNYQRGAGLAVTAGKERGSLTLSNRKLLEKVAAWRFLALPKGQHAIVVDKSGQVMRSFADRNPAKFTVSVLCVGDGLRSERTLGRVDESGVLSITVPDGCLTQKLNVRLGRGRVEDLKLTLQ